MKNVYFEKNNMYLNFSVIVIDILLSKAGFSLKNRDDSKEAGVGIWTRIHSLGIMWCCRLLQYWSFWGWLSGA